MTLTKLLPGVRPTEDRKASLIDDLHVHHGVPDQTVVYLRFHIEMLLQEKLIVGR